MSLLTKGTIDGELPEDAPESEVIELAITLAFLVGCLQILFGFVGLGGVTSFLSHDVLIGFTSGSAVIIAFSQMKYVFGISIGRHHYPWETIADVFSNLDKTDGNELAVSLSCLCLLIGMKIWRKRNPLPKSEKDKKDEATWKKVVRQICSMSALVVVAIYTPMSAILKTQGVRLKNVGKQPEGIPAPDLSDLLQDQHICDHFCTCHCNYRIFGEFCSCPFHGTQRCCCEGYVVLVFEFTSQSSLYSSVDFQVIFLRL